MPRLASLLSVGLVTVASVLLAPSALVAGAQVAIGGVCGNADTCASSGVCVFNHCVPAFTVDDGNGGTTSSDSFNGRGNRCSADDCCANGLECLNNAALGNARQCWPSDEVGSDSTNSSSITVVDCQGSPQEGADLSTPNGSAAGSLGTPCSATSCCNDGLTCLNLSGSGICSVAAAGVQSVACQVTSPTTPSSTTGSSGSDTPESDTTGASVEPEPIPANPDEGASGPSEQTPPSTTGSDDGGSTDGGASGTAQTPSQPAAGSLGQSCGSTTCCTGGLVCHATTSTCGPRVPGLAEFGCNGAPDTAATQTVPVSCSVSNVCTAGSTCLENYCVVNSQVTSGQVWGFGNACSATICCPNQLVCLTDAGSRCGVQTGSLRTTICTASGAATSGQTITSNGLAPAPITPVTTNPGGGGGTNGAASVASVGTPYLACLAAIAALILTLAA